MVRAYCNSLFFTHERRNFGAGYCSSSPAPSCGACTRSGAPSSSGNIARSTNRNLPLEVVLEAIAYCESNPPEIAEDWAADEALAEAAGMNDPNYYKSKRKVLSPQERARLNKR